jgi:hypothetical protein
MEVVVTGEPDYVREKNNDYLSQINIYAIHIFIQCLSHQKKQNQSKT